MSNQRASGAGAEASRRNGAKSRGPKSDEGKLRSAQNALKHGLGAQSTSCCRRSKVCRAAGGGGAEFAALEAALVE